MTARTPQLLITLTPEGVLAVELPGFQATRRQIILRSAEAGETLLRMLEAQARDQAEIGQDGAPTAAQVKHWERHSIWKDRHCRFCIAEGTKPEYIRHGNAKRKKALVAKSRDGVEVRRMPAGVKGSAVLEKKAEELGL